ncbi:hypothetical protein [[Mycobacterium] holstebronense]|uniref:Uncharacterized protein n=1 Tax=[Mycobacterium] holstebronense TaxID=3064288 RepID=A0ABN9NIS5_9MYCO|nr:hypothetical protein [Mycolicibacter sp. MU0102]CAJ1504246.1 hypothetical protein MU0102_002196 [Mycolicibacter sp. MU0102]
MAEPPAGTCWDCDGPCLSCKGSEHGWRCRTCCEAYLDTGAAKAAAADARIRAKQFAKFSEDGRRGGGGLASGRTVTASSDATTMTTSTRNRR